jgi:hypothetical protein
MGMRSLTANGFIIIPPRDFHIRHAGTAEST